MSEKNQDEDEEGGIKQYLNLLSELRGSKEDLDIDTDAQLEFIVRPSREEVAEKAFQELKQESNNPEDIPFNDPRAVLLESERQFYKIRDDLVKKIEDIRRKEEESVAGADIDTMLYVVEDNAGKTGNFTLFGGAESLVYNTGEKYDWHPYEVELILKANRIAAEQNNLHRHLLLDNVLIVPNEETLIER